MDTTERPAAGADGASLDVPRQEPRAETDVAIDDAEDPTSTADTADDKSTADGERDEPPGDERWSAFAPVPTRPPGRLRRGATGLGRGLGHEWTLTVLGGLALAVLMTWPALRYPRHTLPQDAGDPALVSWILAWPGRILLEDPGQLWHGNAFYPDSRWSLAFTDSLLGYAPFGLVGEGPADAILRYNIVYVLSFALAFVGAYALVRQLGAVRAAALVAAVAFAYAPWRLSQAGHLHVLSTGGIVLALAMLARGHGWSLRYGFRSRRVRPGWIVAGWLVAAWQISLGFGIGLVFGYVLALIAVVAVVAVVVWLARHIVRLRAVGRGVATAWGELKRQTIGRIVGANLVGGTIFAATTMLMALPYLTVVAMYPHAQRSLAEAGHFSPPLRGFLTAPEGSRLWGSAHGGARELAVSDGKEFLAGEMALLPGFALLALAAAGLVFSVWSVWTRVWLAACVVASVGLAMGTELFDGAIYEVLYERLPGWDALRTPGRLVIWTTLLLGILAAGAVSAFVARSGELALSRGSPRPGGWLRLAALLPVVLVLAEGLNTTPHVVVPPQPAALASVDGPLLVLPSDGLTDMKVMLWTTDRFPPMVNGGSGFAPPSLRETREATHTFPDSESVSYLRSVGVATVVVLRDRVVGTPWEGALNATGAGLGVTREEVDGAIVFQLNP